MAAQPITMLSALTTAELTLTERGANNRRFAMTKSGGFLMDPKVLQAIVGTQAEGEEDFIEILKSQGVTEQEKIDAAVASFRVQKGMKDLVDNDIMSEVTKAAGYTAKAVTKEEGVAPQKKVKIGDVDPEADKGRGAVKKSVDVSGLDPEMQSTIQAIFKSNADMAERSAKLEAVVKSMTDDREELGYIQKAADEFGHLPMEQKELGRMLKSAHDVAPDLAKGLETLLGRVDEMVQKSELMTNMGATMTVDSGGAMDKFNALVEGTVRKSMEGGNSVSKSDAFNMVLKSEEGARLYNEYLSDNPAQRARTYK